MSPTAPVRSSLLLVALLFMVAPTVPSARAESPQEEAIRALEPYAGLIVTSITLAGNEVTRDWVITREIWTEIGHPLDLETVGDDLIRLENLALFGSVVATGKRRDGGVALNYVFTEMPWIIPYPALKYTEENGFSVGLGIASPNFTGRGITLSASAMAGGATTYKVAGKNPWITGNHVSAGGEAYHQVRANKLLDFEETSDAAILNGGTYLGIDGRFKIHGGYLGIGSDKPGITLSDSNYDDLWHGGFALGLDTRDSWRIPREGWQNELALEYLGGDADTWTLDLDIRRYLPTSARASVATGPLFSFQTGEVDEQIPIYRQYFLGGTNTIRGYELEELGKELYGRNQLLYTVEYRFQAMPIRPIKIFKWSFGVGLELAAFGDVGVAWSRSQDFNLDRTRVGYGLGARLLLPAVESVRFDMGISQYGDFVFNFGMKSIFDGRRQRQR